eukprot:8735881-Alexandrium_andersonii.AAC.1
MRHGKVRLKSDNDPTIVDLLNKVKAARKDEETLLQFSPRYSSQSNGRAERVIQRIRKQARTLRLAIEDSYHTQVTPASVLWPW